MIVTAIINLAYNLISGIISLFPVGQPLPQTVHNAVISIGGYFHILDPLVPISTMATIVGLIFAFEISLFAFRTLRWVIAYIPFVGGK